MTELKRPGGKFAGFVPTNPNHIDKRPHPQRSLRDDVPTPTGIAFINTLHELYPQSHASAPSLDELELLRVRRELSDLIAQKQHRNRNTPKNY